MLLFSFLALSGLPVGAVSLEEQLASRAQALQEEGAYLEAIGAWRTRAELVGDNVTRAASIMAIARIYEKLLRDNEQALREYQTVIRQFGDTPSAPEAWFASGLILQEAGRLAEARPFLLSYLRQYPTGRHRELAALLLDTAPGAVVGEKQPPLIDCQRETIRVLLDRDAPRVEVSARLPLKATDRSGRPLGEAITQAILELSGGALSLNGLALETPAVILAPAGEFLEYRNRRWRGVLLVQAGQAGLQVINELTLEEYLYGVVPREMPPGWPAEALKAQAVAARTYAVYVRARSSNSPYDLCSTVMSQVYGGADSETVATSHAVAATRGRILHYRGAPALTYYHAHSGGVTEDPRFVWSSPLPYLGSRPDEFSLKAPDSFWQASLDFARLRAALIQGGLSVGAIQSVNARQWSPSGRVTSLAITHEAGETFMGGNEFRLLAGPRLIRSTLFDLTSQGETLNIVGRGFGHGVGMSQWGARVMADEGYNYREILGFYYPALGVD